MAENHTQVKATRRAVRAFGATLVLLLTVVAVRAYVRTAALETTCQKVNGVQAIVSTILVRSEAIGLKHPSPKFSEAQERAFYARALRELAPATC